MSEFSEHDSQQEEINQYIENTITDGRDMVLQLDRILKANQINPDTIKSSLHLDSGYGTEIMFAQKPSIKNVTVTEPPHPNGDIPKYIDEDDYLQDISVQDVHTSILDNLSLDEREKVHIRRESAEAALKIFSQSGQSFDLVTSLNIFPYKLKSRIGGIAREMLSVTNPGGIVVITTQEGDDTVLNDLSQDLKDNPNISKVFVQPVGANTGENSSMEALGTLAIIIQKK